MAKFGAEKIRHPISDTTAKYGTKSPDRGTRAGQHRERWLRDTCCHSLGAVRPKSANNDPLETWLRSVKPHGTMRHTFVVPNFAIPNLAFSSTTHDTMEGHRRQQQSEGDRRRLEGHQRRLEGDRRRLEGH